MYAIRSYYAGMIAEKLAELGIDLDKRRIQLEAPIRALGDYAVPVRLHQDVKVEVTVRVLREGA